MTLGTKTLLGLGASFAFWCMLLYWANATLLRPSFEALELKNLERNCERARKAFADQAQTLSSKVGDWALWDDTYEYIESHSEEYITANLNAESMDTLDLDFMVFVDAKGEVVHVALRDSDVGTTITAPAMHALLAANPRLTQHGDVKSSHHGLTLLDDKLLMLACRPIHRSDLTGAARGCLLAGRIVSDAAIAALRTLTQIQLEVAPSQQRLATTVIDKGPEKIAGTIGLLDVFGQPVASCTIRMPREIHREGEAALRLLLVALLISSCLALLTTLGGIDNVVLRRLRALRGVMHDITRTGDLGKKAPVAGNDEISDLARTLNTLTSQLDETQRRLLQANESRSQFLANVSHEVRTPVTALLGFVDLLQDEKLSRAQHDDFVNTIRRNAQHLLTILNDLLDTAKIESGQMAVERVSTSLAPLLHESLDMARAAAARKGLALALEQRTPLPETIQTDPTRLRQILANLLGNAVKFTERGSVRLVADMTDDGKLRLAVVDTGIGITEEQKARLFLPFSQADATTSRRFGGTGLGLVLSRNLARCLGGDVVLRSEPGSGSTFVVTIAVGPMTGVAMLDDVPHRDPRVAKAPATTPIQKRLQGRRVLVVDDAPDNRRLVSFVLQKAGAEVDTAENGRLGVDQVIAAASDGRPYDLVVMDMQMPVLDGYGATTELRQRGFDQPILALTANAMQADLEACIRAGCTDYATKPIDKNHLVTLLEAMLPPQTVDALRSTARADTPWSAR